MKTRILKTLTMCAVLLICAASLAHAIPQCEIVQSSIPWNQDNQATWIAGTYQLQIQCMDNNGSQASPVVNCQQSFHISLMDWQSPTQGTKLADLYTYSTLTDSNGIGYINVPLLHLQNGASYIHICPFDDIQCTGGPIILSQLSQAAPANTSGVTSITAAETTGCTNTNTLTGCCETTIEVTCCSRTFTYCSAVTEGQCSVGQTTTPDQCTTITTSWNPNGTCNYCNGYCEVTAINLSSFTAKAGNGSVLLNWVTETEIDNAGFNILRADSENGKYVKINADIISSKAGATQGASYQFIDTNARNRKTYYYKLEDIDLNGTATLHGPESATPKLMYAIFK